MGNQVARDSTRMRVDVGAKTTSEQDFLSGFQQAGGLRQRCSSITCEKEQAGESCEHPAAVAAGEMVAA